MKKFLSLILTVLLCAGVLTACGGNQESSGASENKDTSQTASQSGVKTVKAGADDLVAAAFDEDGNYGYINTKGQWVIAPQYGSALSFSGGVAAVYTDESPRHWEIIDKTGHVVATFDKNIKVYGGGGYVNNSVLAAFLKDSTPGNSSGNISDGMLIISDATMTKFGCANIKGEVIVEPKYTQMFAFSEGLAAVNFGTANDKKWGYIDKQGNIVVAGQYKEAHPFSCGLAYVEWETTGNVFPNGSIGFIDQKGQLVIHGTGKDGNGNPIWSGFTGFISDFINDLAVCQYGDSTGNQRLAVINKSGVAVWIDTDGKYWVPNVQAIGEGLFHTELLSDSEKTGFLDTSGAVTVAFRSGWKFKSFFCEGLCKVIDTATGKYGYIDRSGATVIPVKYAVATPFLNGYAVVSTDGQTYSYIDTKGNTVAAGNYENASMPFTK